MKKEIIIVIIIVILIVIGHITTQKYTRNFFDSISKDLKNLENNMYLENAENEQLNSNINDIQEKWKSKYNVLAYYIEHDELEKVKTQLVSIKADIMVEEYDKGVEEIEKCIFILEHIKDKDSMELVNIF